MATIFGLIFFLSFVLLVLVAVIDKAEGTTSKVAIIITVAFGLSLLIYWYGEKKVDSVTQSIQDYLVYENLYCEWSTNYLLQPSALITDCLAVTYKVQMTKKAYKKTNLTDALTFHGIFLVCMIAAQTTVPKLDFLIRYCY